MTADAAKSTTLAMIAGGLGSRMGAPKDTLRIAGRPIVRHLMERLAWPGPRLLVVAHDAAEGGPGQVGFDAVARDAVAGQGPVRGVVSALEHATTEAVLTLAVDMPWVERGQLDWLLEEQRLSPARAIIIDRAGRCEPFPSLFTRGIAGEVRDYLGRGERSMHGLASLPGVRIVEAPAWDRRVWANLNRPEDLARWGEAGQ